MHPVARWGRRVGTLALGLAGSLVAMGLVMAATNEGPATSAPSALWHGLEVAVGLLAGAGGLRLLIPTLFKAWLETRRGGNAQTWNGVDRRAEGDFAGHVRSELGTIGSRLRDAEHDRTNLNVQLVKLAEGQGRLVALLETTRDQLRDGLTVVRSMSERLGTMDGLEHSLTRLSAMIGSLHPSLETLEAGLSSVTQATEVLLKDLHERKNSPPPPPFPFPKKRGKPRG